jgi:hypothetical protein
MAPVTRVLCTFITACLALGWTQIAGRASESIPRVRTTDPVLSELLREGIARSGTFRTIVERIDRTDGIVYFEPGTCSITPALACLLIDVHDAGQTRNLNIHVRPHRSSPDERIAIIGHELQHANEVLSARWVRTAADAYSLFMRIGSAESVRNFETAEAIRVGDTVASELAAHRADTTSASGR